MKFCIPIEPVTKKNSQQIAYTKTGRPFVVPSAIFKRYQKAAARYVPAGETLKGPVQVTGIFYRKTCRTVDLTNLLEALDDLLVECGLLADDSWKVIASHDGSRVRFDKDNPRTEVTIRDFIE